MQDGVYAEYGVDQEGFKYCMGKFEGSEEVKRCFTEIMMAQQSLTGKLAMANAPPWYVVKHLLISLLPLTLLCYFHSSMI